MFSFNSDQRDYFVVSKSCYSILYNIDVVAFRSKELNGENFFISFLFLVLSLH